MDLGGGKDSYLGLPVSHGEEEGNGEVSHGAGVEHGIRKWTSAKIERA